MKYVMFIMCCVLACSVSGAEPVDPGRSLCTDGIGHDVVMYGVCQHRISLEMPECDLSYRSPLDYECITEGRGHVQSMADIFPKPAFDRTHILDKTQFKYVHSHKAADMQAIGAALLEVTRMLVYPPY